MFAVTDYKDGPDVQLDATVAHNGSRTSGEYPGYDRFGRVARHAWVDGALTTHSTDSTVPNIPPIVELEYEYNKAGDRLLKADARPRASIATRDEQYMYDGLHRLKEAHRGVRSGSTVNQGAGSQSWSLDALGNWTTWQTDNDADGAYTADGETETRIHNLANELTDREIDEPTPVELELAYTASGALFESDRVPGGRFDYTHDAWGRLTSVTIYYTAMLQEPRGVYEYNGLNWRTVVLRDAPPNFAGYVTQRRTLCYDQRWRLLEERIDDDARTITAHPAPRTPRHHAHRAQYSRAH